MPDNLLLLADLVADALHLSGAEASELLQDAPFFNLLPIVEPSNGTTHKYIKETAAPVVGFRVANDGRPHSKSTDELVTIALEILDFSWHVDKAVADAWRNGGPEALIAREGARNLAAALAVAERQYINGKIGGAAAGFAGFADSDLLKYSDAEGVVNAGGVQAGKGSSVYLVRVSSADVQGVMPGALELGETVVQKVDGENGSFPAYYTPGCTWTGLQIGAKFSVVRIANLDPAATLNDDLLFDALEKFPAGRQPTHVLMSRRSQSQLRKSRTATNATGAPAPRPTEVEGIPIVTTDSIRNTETLLAPAP